MNATGVRLLAYGALSILLLSMAGPIALLAICAAGGYLLVRKRTSLPAKAAAAALLPLAVGLTIVSAFVALLNIALSSSTTDASVTQVKGIEDFVHSLASRLPSILKPAFAVQLLMLSGLYLLALFNASMKPVSGFVEGNRWAGRVLATAAIVTSFTVFSQEADVLQDRAGGRIKAVYTASRQRQGDALNRYVAAKAIVETLQRPSDRAYLTSVVSETAGMSLKDESATHLSAYLGKRLLFGEAAAAASTPRTGTGIPEGELPATWLGPRSPWLPPPINRQRFDAAVVVPSDANAFIADQKAREDAAVAAAAAEQKLAIETILTGAADAGTSRVKAVAESLVESLIQCQGDFFGDQMTNYLTRVLDRSFKALIEPLAKQAADRLQTRIQLALRSGRSEAEAARTSTVEGLTDLTVRVPMEYLRIAERAAETTPHGFLEALTVRGYSSKARELLNAFEPATPDGAIDMRLVSDVLDLVMPKVKSSLEDDAARRQLESERAKIRGEILSGARRGGRRAR